MNWDRLHKITTSRNLFQSHSCKVVSKASCFLSISVWGVLKFRYPQVPIPWLLWYMSANSLTGLIRWIMIVDEKLERVCLNFFSLQLAVCVRFAPIFWDFNMWKCYIPKWLIIYCSPIIHKLREPTQNGVIQFMVTKRGQISKWIWVSKPQPTIGIWLCMSFRWKSQLHTVQRDWSFDAILRAFFVGRPVEIVSLSL